MPHMQHIDELIREYFLFRGFTNALKWFDFDVKLDKDKGFRVSGTLLYTSLIFPDRNYSAHKILHLIQWLIKIFETCLSLLNINYSNETGFFLKVDKLVDQILQLVYSYDLSTIRELWSHFENKLFSKLDQDISYGLYNV